jgi:radical SAM superfamily enzyme YgiQ (UPF0313 family)
VPELAATGCVFIVSAVESLSDVVLAHLEKGHTRADVSIALDVLRRAGIPLRPSFIPFTPWATLGDYREILDFVERQDLIDPSIVQYDPISSAGPLPCRGRDLAVPGPLDSAGELPLIHPTDDCIGRSPGR